MQQIPFGGRSPPRTHWGAYSAPQNSAGLKETTSCQGGEARNEEGKGRVAEEEGRQWLKCSSTQETAGRSPPIYGVRRSPHPTFTMLGEGTEPRNVLFPTFDFAL